jgi:hypothetical protein
MAFAVSKRTANAELTIPKDAVKLTEEQALIYFLKIVDGWKEDKDV